MLSTGLKDINDIDIFEGDIIRDDYAGDYEIKFVEYYYDDMFIIGFYFCDNKPFGRNMDNRTYEIIGNIYEHE